MRTFSPILLILLVSIVEAQQIPKPRPSPRPTPTERPPRTPRKESQTPSPSATLLLTCDVPCSIEVDGESHGNLEANETKAIPAAVEQHLIRASSTENSSAVWKKAVDVIRPGKTVVMIDLADQLKAARANNNAAAQPQPTDLPAHRLPAQTVAPAPALEGQVPAQNTALVIEWAHQPIPCTNPMIANRICAVVTPIPTVSSPARLYFRAKGEKHFSFVTMATEGVTVCGTFPGVRDAVKRIEYYIEANRATRTPTYQMAVDSPTVCEFPPREPDARRANAITVYGTPSQGKEPSTQFDTKGVSFVVVAPPKPR